MKTLLLCMLLSATANACPSLAELVSDKSKPVSPAVTDRITKQMPVPEILKILGPAVRDVGSGLYVLQWDLTDGGVFFVSTADLCGTPMGLGVGGRPPNKAMEPTR